MWHQVTNDIHRIDQKFSIFNADMNMSAEDQHTLREFLHILLHAHVALLRCNLLRHPGRKRVGAGRDDLQAVLCCQLHNGTSQAHQLVPQLSRSLAYGGPDLDHCLVQLWFDLLEQDEFTLFQYLGDTRTQFSCLWVDDLVLFLDPYSERRCFHNTSPSWLSSSLALVQKHLTFSAFPCTIPQGVSGLAETECRSA